MSRNGVLPRFLSCWNTKRNIPSAGVILNFILFIIFILVLTLDQLNDLNMAEYVSQWLQRAITALLLLYIRMNRVPVGDNVFRMNILFPCLYLVCLVSMALSTLMANWHTVIFTVATSMGGLLIYWIFQWPKGLKRWPVMAKALTSIDGKSKFVS
jgi:amino acid transporter